MQTGAFTEYFDVAQVTLYAFWIFFAGLIFYLRREDKREGYPLENDRSARGHRVEGFPPMPTPKTFLLADGHTIQAPRVETPPPLTNAVFGGMFPGAPLLPTGNAMIDGIGPAAYAHRHDVAEVALGHGLRIVPLRAAPEFYVDEGAPSPIGMEVIGADKLVAGKVTDVWIDKPDATIRYFEVELTGLATPRRVLLPVPFAVLKNSQRKILVSSILASQFAHVPGTKEPESVTLLEEDKIMAYFGGGTLYATPGRQEPLL